MTNKIWLFAAKWPFEVYNFLSTFKKAGALELKKAMKTTINGLFQ